MQMTKALPQRSDPHFARRLWHFTGVFSMFLIEYLTPADALKVALCGSTIWITLDLLRLRFQTLNQRLMWFFRPFMRESERNNPSGASFMVIGVTLIVYFFPRPVVLLTLLFFSLADPMAGYIGTRFGKDKLIGSKSLQGSLAAFAVCFVLTLIYCIAFHTMTERLVIVAVVCGMIGSVSELVPIWRFDDNFVFPVLCAALLNLAFLLFGGI